MSRRARERAEQNAAKVREAKRRRLANGSTIAVGGPSRITGATTEHLYREASMGDEAVRVWVPTGDLIAHGLMRVELEHGDGASIRVNGTLYPGEMPWEGGVLTVESMDGIETRDEDGDPVMYALVVGRMR